MAEGRCLVISDLHGCFYTFQSWLDEVGLTVDDRLFILGDYVDRGEDSKGVIDQIWHLQAAGYQVHPLMGNHEELLLRGTRTGDDDPVWLRFGGRQTLASFDVGRSADIPKKYLRWLAALPSYLTHENYLFVHAGLNFKVGDPMTDAVSMRWIRDWYDQIDYNWLGNRYVIHGHTPQPRSVIEDQWQQFEKNRFLDLDGGCVYDRPGMGHLCWVNLTQRTLHFKKRVQSSN